MPIDATALLLFDEFDEDEEITDALLADAEKGDLDWITVSDPSGQTPGPTPNLTVKAAAGYPIWTPIRVNGATYPAGGTKGMRCNMSDVGAIQAAIDPGSNASVLFPFRWNGAQIDFSPRDVSCLRDPVGGYQFLQLKDGVDISWHTHWQPGGSGIGADNIIVRSHWYMAWYEHVNGGQDFVIDVYDTDDLATPMATGTGAVSGSYSGGASLAQLGIIFYDQGASQSFDLGWYAMDRTGAMRGPGDGPNGNITFSGTLTVGTLIIG